MEQKKEDSNIRKVLEKVCPSLPTDIAKIIVMYKHSIEEGEKLNKREKKAAKNKKTNDNFSFIYPQFLAYGTIFP